jgi:hypothetical protein
MPFHSALVDADLHTPCYISESDPGAVGAGIAWFKRTTREMKIRNAADSGWDMVTATDAIPLSYLDTDATLAANSNTKVASQAAVKAYTDALVAGLSWKQAVRVATTGAGTLASDFENGDTVDGVTLATGDRILIKNQAAPTENGIYVVAASGAPTRATDANSGAELVNASCYVSEGTANADTQWTCTTNATITIGATNIVFAQITGTGGGVTSVLGQTGAVTFVVSVPFVIDGGGAVITTGIKGDLEIPFAGTITAWRVVADQAGDIVIDTWKDTYANFPPDNSDSIWGGSEPELSGAAKAEATGLSIAVTAGDWLRFNVDSVATVERVTLSLTITRTS